MGARHLNEGLSLGVPQLDEEHELQLALLGALAEALKSGATGQVEAMLSQLMDYSEVHFLSEELLMRFYSYPDYEEHVSEHAHLIDRVLELKERWSDGDGNAPTIVQELHSWLATHIREMDQPLARFVKAHPAAPKT